MKRYIVESFIAINLAVISAAHLRLYYIGVWYDPIKAVEIAEVVFLYIFIVLGVSYFIWRFIKQWKEKK